MSKPVIGFVGLGLMGMGCITRYVAQGYHVIGFDVLADKMQAAAAIGAETGAHPGDVMRSADIISCSVTTPQNVADIVRGADGLMSAGNQPGKIFVDHSTTPIELTIELGELLRGHCDIEFIDAPVSGGPAAAETGTLAIMAGGSDAAIATVTPVMTALGDFTHMGEPGAGQATKLINQTLVLTNYCVIAEALNLAERYGVDAAKIPDALAAGHAGSNLLPVLFERMIARDWAPRGFARQVLKDLEMLNDAAHLKGAAMPMSGQALTLYRMLAAQGKSELDGAAVFELLSKQ